MKSIRVLFLIDFIIFEFGGGGCLEIRKRLIWLFFAQSCCWSSLCL